MGKFYGNTLKAGRNWCIVSLIDQAGLKGSEVARIFDISRQAVWRAYWDSKKKLGVYKDNKGG